MANFGVLATGFNPKPFATVQAELQAAFQQAFGPGIILSDESPAGQIVGLASSFTADLWQELQSVYASYDPDQAEGVRLDMLAKLRLLSRGADESDETFRSALSNAGRAHINVADIVRALKSVNGVTYAKVFVNDGSTTDTNGIPAHSVAAVVDGGSDEDIADVLRTYVVPGVGTYGSTTAAANVDGYCRTLFFTRPTYVPIKLNVVVDRDDDKAGCSPPSLASVASGLYTYLTTTNPPENGDDITLHLLRTGVSCTFPSVEVTAASGARGDAALSALPIVLAFDEIAQFSISNIAVVDA